MFIPWLSPHPSSFDAAPHNLTLASASIGGGNGTPRGITNDPPCWVANVRGIMSGGVVVVVDIVDVVNVTAAAPFAGDGGKTDDCLPLLKEVEDSDDDDDDDD